jgi:hypothetical protein
MLYEDVWRDGSVAAPFSTLALDRDERTGSCPGRFDPGEKHMIPIGYETGWIPESV